MFFLSERLWLGSMVLQKGAATQGSTPLFCTVLSYGQGKESYTDSPRIRDKSRGCRESNDYTQAIKTST
jgi:hypothetical protein